MTVRTLPLRSALIVATGALILAPAPADAECTSSVEVRRGRNGDVRPQRRVSCEASARERARAERDTAERLTACRDAGFGEACDRVLATYSAGLARHRAHIEQRAERRAERQLEPRPRGRSAR